MTPDAFIRQIAEVSIGASADELRVIICVAERLRMGRDVYGPLNVKTSGRDYAKDLREEIYDAMAYCAMKAIAGQP